MPEPRVPLWDVGLLLLLISRGLGASSLRTDVSESETHRHSGVGHALQLSCADLLAVYGFIVE